VKILIADDDKALVHMLASKFSERGFEIFAAYDAIQAWMAVMRYVPDAVVLDVSMPGGTGIEVLRKLKQFPKTSAIPSVVISGVTDHLLAEKAKALGADEFLAKPFSPEQLLQSLERVTGVEAPPPKAQATHQPSGFRILVADDDAATRRALEALLSKWGYAVTSVGGGQQAWQILQSESAPQLAIIDWMMPDIEGIEICRMLRERASERYTYILLLTSKSEKVELVEGMNAGADDYIVKPFDPAELKVRLAAGRRIVGLQEDLLAMRARMKAALDSATRGVAPLSQ
jgi:DNA-binding response OmpR family regulator